MAPITYDFNHVKVWDGTLLKDLVVPFADLCQRMKPYPSARNPNYQISIDKSSHNWAYTTNSPTPEHQKRLNTEGVVIWTSYIYPDAKPDQLRLIADFTLWLILYDDVRDDADKAGVAGYSEESSTLDAMMIKYMQSFQKGESTADVPDMILSNIRAKAVVDLLERFKNNGLPEDQLDIFCQGLIDYVQGNKTTDTSDSLTFEEYVKERRRTIGMVPFIVLMDWTEGYSLSPKLRRHPIVQEINTCIEDWSWLSNDVNSLPKEVLQ